jgi:hypothetical protein
VSEDHPAPPMTKEQVETLFAALRQVIESPDGFGEVTIMVQCGHVRFIRQEVSLDLKRCQHWDRLEALAK